MIKAIIIDDEKLIREGLVTYIDWAALDIHVCAICKDGASGIQAVIEHRPQIILADICLPDISGLDMLRQIRSYGLACQVIFISSYSEFKYAQQAVKLEAFDYLLKPIEADVLYDCVKRCVRKLTADTPSAGVDRTLAEQVLHDALTNVPLADRTFLHLCGQLGIGADARPFLFVSTDSVPNGSNGRPYINPTLPATFEKQLVACYHTAVSERIDCVCFFTNSKNDEMPIYEGIGRIQRGNPAGTILYCCSDPTISLYTNLQLALCQIILRSIPQEYSSKYFEKDSEQYFIPSREELAPQLIRSLDSAALQAALHHFFLFCHQHNWTLKHLDFQFECFKFLENIYKQLTQYYGVPLPASLDMHDFIAQLRQPNNIYDLYLTLCGILTTAFTELKKNSFQSPHTRKVLAIIRERYGESLTLKSIARELHVSSSYLSTVFKEDTGHPFSDYLFSYRMNIAYGLLKEGNYRVYEIGEKVGYPDIAQFSKAFKKQFGMSPTYLKGTGMN